MTASTVDVFPCRVQLLGLPSSTNTAAANTARPPEAKIQGISRNLFGAPDPGEMKVLYQQESERIRSYVLKRYNFDTKILKSTNDEDCKEQHRDKIHTNLTSIVPEMQPTKLPFSIAEELSQHQQGLLYRKQSPRSSSDSAQHNKKIMKHANKFSHRTNDLSSSLLPAVARQKLYRRQSLLKESFNIRKKRVSINKSIQYCNSEAITLKHSQNCYGNFEILQLSQNLMLQQRKCDIQDKVNENYMGEHHTETGEKRSRKISCSDNCTTLSLQFVMSTQNMS